MNKINNKEPCCKKGCSSVGTRKVAGNKNGGSYYYCAFHNRVRQMRDRAKCDNKTVPSVDELESMLTKAISTGCNRCGKTMTLSSPRKNTTRNATRNTASLQHNLDGSIEICCQSCNSRHGRHSLGDAFWELSNDEQFCSGCKLVKPLEHFHKDISRFSGRQGVCKECCNSKSKIYRKTKLTYANG